MMLIFSPLSNGSWLCLVVLKKETLKGVSQSQMTRGKQSPGKDIKTQKSSELHSQGKGVNGPPVQMSKHLIFALYVTHITHATVLKSNMKKQFLDFTLESN